MDAPTTYDKQSLKMIIHNHVYNINDNQIAN
jgi:hypothetical protein